MQMDHIYFLAYQLMGHLAFRFIADFFLMFFNSKIIFEVFILLYRFSFYGRNINPVWGMWWLIVMVK
jgi:hypothetical protein